VSTPTPLGAVARGLASGAVGTAALTAARGAGEQSRATAGVPAEIARRVASGVFERPVDGHAAARLGNAARWGYGTALGALFGVMQGTLGRRPARNGLIFGGAVWAAGLANTRAMALAPPPWRLPASELAADGAVHLLYGLSVGVSYGALSLSPPRALPARPAVARVMKRRTGRTRNERV